MCIAPMTREIEYLKPAEYLQEMARRPIAYLPVGLLEWHGPALPFGTDTLAAHRACAAAAERTGGLILPPLSCGTGARRSRAELEEIGLSEPPQGIFGMDYPANSVRSFYARVEVFEAMIEDSLRMIEEHGFRVAALVTGHAGDGFTDVMQAQCAKISARNNCRAALFHAWADVDQRPYHAGHANLMETAVAMYLGADTALDRFPPRETPLQSRDWGLYDPAAQHGQIVEDPRDATIKLGKLFFERGIEEIVRQVNLLWQQTEESK